MVRSFAALVFAVALSLGLATSAAAEHEHFLVTPGMCVSDIGSGQTSQASGGGFHRFHENMHVGTAGTLAMTQTGNPVQIYKVDQAGAPMADCP